MLKCTARPQHISSLYAEMAAIDDSNLVIGDLSKADYLWVIRQEEKLMVKDNKQLKR
jgi:hypothetical protein